MAQEVEQQKSRWGQLKKRLQNRYRLVIMNNETFEEMGSYRLTLLNVYLFLSSIVVVVALIVVLLVAFSPVRKYVPGYGDIQQDEELRDLYDKTQRMEKELAAYRLYSENFQRILVGEGYQTEADLPEINADSQENFLALPPSPEEEQLREEMELEEVGQAAKYSRSTNLSPKDLPLEQMFFSPPITGDISAGFMPDGKHYGVDVLAPKNTPVKAAMDGYVFLSDWTLETGNTIGIQHANNVITFYKHNSMLLKKVGSYVKAGEAVAIIGNTGTLSNGPHLHFELWHNGLPVDPTEYVNF